GVLRTLIEGDLSLDLRAAIDQALSLQPKAATEPIAVDLFDFHLERLRGYYAERGYTAEQFAAVAANEGSDMLDFDRRIRAIAGFITLPQAAIVSAAHKRARNLLKKKEISTYMAVDQALLSDRYEQALAVALARQQQTFERAMATRAYAQALASLAELAEPLDAFFDHVMVMTDNDELRRNRLALLATLDARCRQV